MLLKLSEIFTSEVLYQTSISTRGGMKLSDFYYRDKIA